MLPAKGWSPGRPGLVGRHSDGIEAHGDVQEAQIAAREAGELDGLMCLPFQVVLIAKVQALAAIGQGRLIALWDNLFSLLGQPIAQVLLTRSDISDVHLVIRDDMTPSLTR